MSAAHRAASSAWLALLALLLGLVALLAAAAPAHALGAAHATGEQITAQDVRIEIDRSGDLLIDETITYDFGITPRRGIQRELVTNEIFDEDYERNYGIDVRSVSATGGAPDDYELLDVGESKVIRIGDPNITITGEHTYRISYRVSDALNGFDDHDELYWDALGDRTPVPIERASVQVIAPGKVSDPKCFVGQFGAPDGCVQVAQSENEVTFTATQVPPKSFLTVAVSFPKGLVPTPDPDIRPVRYSAAFWRQVVSIDGATMGLAAAGLAAVLAAAGGVVLRMRGKSGSTPPPAKRADGVVPVEFAPPADLLPGQIGTLLDERAEPRDVAATLINLAQRGYLRIAEVPGVGNDWTLTRVRSPDAELCGYETTLMKKVFTGATVRMSALEGRFAKDLATVQRELYADAIAAGWFRFDPVLARNRWRLGALVVVIGWVALAWGAVSMGRHLLATLPVLAAAAWLTWQSRVRSHLTQAGADLAARIKGFRRFITEADADRARLAERENVFLEYLPHAVALGVTDRWADAFDSLAVIEPNWYSGEDDWDPARFGDRIAQFTRRTSSALATRPPSSNSSGSSGSSGGSSRSSSSSGSRSSGGGGGGGGTSSW
ncbi:MAG: DUF2207 domain-containing protein [Sporichthyaceae bacterium]